jgi:polysaccharide biosynthesis/export protein
MKSVLAGTGAMAGTMIMQAEPRRRTRSAARAVPRIVQAALLAVLLLAAVLGIMAVALPGAAQAAVPDARASRGYVLGPDDGVSVLVYGQTEFNVSTRVKPDGTIVLPLVGKITATGTTVVTLAEEVTRKLTAGGYLKDPIVNVEITSFGSRYVRVAGKVAQPALVPLDRNYRALDVLLRAGWVRDDGATYVVLRRAGDGREQIVNVVDLARGDPEKDPLLEAGDTLFVPEADLVYVSGQINRPGAFPLKPGMTVRQLLASAGGVTQTGSANKVGLTRGNAKETDADGTTVLQRNDVIVVKERLF